MVSIPIAIIVEAPKMAESTPIIVAEKPKAKVDEAQIESISHEATSKDTMDIIVYITSFGPTPVIFAPPEVVTKAKVKKMMELAMNNFAEKQKAKNKEFRRTMKQAITT